MDINDIVKRLSPYHSLIIMLIFFGGIIISLYKIIISPSDLRVSVRNEAATYPSSVADNFDAINDYLIDQDKDSLALKSLSAFHFLLNTNNIKTIKLKNTSNNTLRNINFKHLNSKNLNAFSITSSYMTSEELNDLRENLVQDENREIIYLKRNVDLPPQREIIITLWGNFPDDDITQNVIVDYEGGNGFFEKQYVVTGFQGYIYENTFQFIFIVLIIFCVVYYLGIKDLEKKINDTAS